MIRIAVIQILIGLGASASLASSEPVLEHRILTLPLSAVESVATGVVQHPDGQHESGIVTSQIVFMGEKDFVTQFQQRPLDANRFLPDDLKEELLNATDHGVSPRQLILVIQFSRMSLESAKKLFPDAEVLKKRIIQDNQMDWGDSVRIVRGAMWAVRGFHKTPDGEIEPLQLPWESPKYAAHRHFELDRKEVPAIYEIGRTLVEASPLPGDFTELSRLMTAVLASECHAMKLDPQEVLFTAFTISPAQSRTFIVAGRFPLRFMNAHAAEELSGGEGRRQEFLKSYLERPIPKGPEWEQHHYSTLFGTLAEFQSKFPIAGKTRLGEIVAKALGGRLTPQQSLFFWRDYSALLRGDFTFTLEPFGSSAKPIVVSNFRDVLYLAKIISLLKEYGLTKDQSVERALAEFFGKVVANHDLPDEMYVFPDLLSTNWYRSDGFAHPAYQISLTDPKPFRPISHLVLNVDPEAVKKFPGIYLASLILALAARVTDEILALSNDGAKILLLELNSTREQQRLKPVASITPEAYFETYGIAFVSLDQQINSDLKLLGGVEFMGVSRFQSDGIKLQAGAPFPPKEGGTTNILPRLTPFYEFKGAQIKAVAAQYPYLRVTARNLDPRPHALCTRLFAVATF